MSENVLPHHHGSVIEDSLESLPPARMFMPAAELMKRLGDATRIRIFWLLCHGEECVINISAIMGMTSPAVSHHLRLLKSAGLIESSRKGKEVYYRAVNSESVRLLHGVIEEIMQISCPFPSSAFVESEDVKASDVEN